MKKFLPISVLVSSAAFAQIYIDSAGTAVQDSSGDGREGRGTELASGSGGGLDLGDVSLIGEDVSRALQDLGLDPTSDNSLTATCTIPAKQLTYFECPSHTDGNCNFSGTPNMSSATSTIVDASSRSVSSLIGSATGSSDEQTFSVQLTPKGYNIFLNGSQHNEAPVQSLSEYDGTLFDSLTQTVANKVMNKPVIIMPGFLEQQLTSKTHEHCYQRPMDFAEICSHWRTYEVGREFERYAVPSGASQASAVGVGVYNQAATGALLKTLAIRDLEHIVSAGVFTHTVKLTAEVAMVDTGSGMQSFYPGAGKVESQIVQFKGYQYAGTQERRIRWSNSEWKVLNLAVYNQANGSVSSYVNPSVDVGGSPAVVTVTCNLE